VILVPYARFLDWTEGLHITTMESTEFYWHIRIIDDHGKYELRRKKGFHPIDVTPYLLKSAANPRNPK
jgi:hypothetical protein